MSTSDDLLLLAHTKEAFTLVGKEFQRQHDKWGHQYHTIPEWAMITSEEFGEAIAATNGKDLEQTAKELIDTIACALHWFHEVRRQQKGITTGTYTETNTLANGNHERDSLG